MKFTLKQAIFAFFVLCQAGITFASDKSVTIFPAEGSKRCSDYAANGKILQMAARRSHSDDDDEHEEGRTSALPSSGVMNGPENPRDADTTGESASYSISGGTQASFTAATTPIDFAILKSNNKVALIIYPTGGVTEDSNMTLMVAGQAQPISGMTLCYGLGNPTPFSTIIKACNTDTSQPPVSCPLGRALMCNFDLGAPFYGMKNASESCCVCNSNADLHECDPGVAAGHPNACPQAMTKVGTEVTTHIELNNDPYVCTTVAGVRKCYAY